MPACHAGDRRFESGRVRHHSAFPYAPSARPDGAFLCPAWHGRRGRSALHGPVRPTSVTLRPVKGRPFPVLARPAARRPGDGARRRPARHRRRRLEHGPGFRAERDRRPLRAPPPPPRPGARRRPLPAKATLPRSHRPAQPRPRPPPARSPTSSIVPVTNFRAPQTSTTHAELEDVLAGKSTRYTALELVAGEADAILAALKVDRPSDSTRLVLANGRGVARRRPHQERQAARLPARRRGRPGGPRAGLGRQGAVRRRSGQGDQGLAADRPAAGPRRRPTPTTRRRPGPCSPAATSCSTAASTRPSRSRARAPTSRSTAAPPTSPRRVCCSSFGWEVPRTQRTGDAGAVRALIKGADIALANFENPAPDKPRYHTSGTVFSADPQVHRRPRRRRHRLRLARQQPHPRRRRRRAAPDHQERHQARDRRVGRGQEPGRGAQAGHPRARAASRSRSSATTRSPARTTRPPPRSAARRCRPRTSRPTSPPRARPARTSSSSTRTGAPNTTTRRSRSRSCWPG